MYKTLALTGLVALTACSERQMANSSFWREAGVLHSNADFGNSTMNNIMYQNGERSYAVDLSNRFAREVPSMVNFAFNSAVLDETARANLRRQADWIRQFPEVRFRVYGHTDKVGSNYYNKRLGLRRARAVVHYLTSLGVDRSRLEAVVSYGETQPLVVTEGRERRNRRTVTEVSGFLKRHPTVMDGKYAEVIYREYVASAEPTSNLEGITGADFGTDQ
ncbi:OmpA family protein [Lutimaribacter sp. EGI FJ00015]|uniref:OmpA family protein n=1 Tax=Lutimaribacter degradans TaxID=2945989 RepID=A0ACC5ZQM7_9RHOB|nr:OmpA family protein [Lutimaribacter sp. EGI FJ00013]MCM2560614.1 OmpA family protein [Lutimaribacter sp. EGI FJ00013]MCO0612443.1 OmpA family protein [Lutimaribacter sp. EGI FJ00015]MCO0634438.1 OmpA family protein [Lutimaribacter sp. EGI FJ00014]